VVVDHFHIISIPVIEAEHEAPASGEADSEASVPAAAQGMESRSREVHFRGVAGIAEAVKDAVNLAGKLGWQPMTLATGEALGGAAAVRADGHSPC